MHLGGEGIIKMVSCPTRCIKMNERNYEKKYYEGQIIEYRGENDTTTTLTIIRMVPVLCLPNGRNEVFPQRKAFLCRVENLPFKNRIGTFSMISGYAVLGDDPSEKLIDWVELPLEWVDETWNESDLFSKTPEEAVDAKIKNLEKIWHWTTLRHHCQSCTKKGEECQRQLRTLLNKISFSFSPFSSP